MNKPNIDNITKWVEALESGDYSQSDGSLRRGDSFCCLGVACEISKEELGLKWDLPEVMTGYIGIAGGTAYLPDPVVKWLGLDKGCNNPKVIYDDDEGYAEVESYAELAALNDNGTPFPEIAELIRKTFLQ